MTYNMKAHPSTMKRKKRTENKKLCELASYAIKMCYKVNLKIILQGLFPIIAQK